MYLISCIVILASTAIVYLINIKSTVKKFSGYQNENFDLPYDVSNPDTVYLMPYELKEVSGLSFKDTNRVFAINDEKGFLYTYNFAEGKVEAKIDFGKRGDYEAVTIIDSTVYIGESNGNIHVVDLQQGKKTDEFKTFLSKRNDTEGLCYDSINNQLLVACKGETEEKSNNRQTKGIYSFDLQSNTLSKTPFKKIQLIEEHLTLKPLNLTDHFVSNLNINSRIKAFAPSAIAINPISSNIYILSSRGKILIVLDPNKALIGVYFLSKHLYGQPEGITFNKQGDMYVSNEAKSSHANILKFNRVTE